MWYRWRGGSLWYYIKPRIWKGSFTTVNLLYNFLAALLLSHLHMASDKELSILTSNFSTLCLRVCECAGVHAYLLSHVRLFATPRTVTHKAPVYGIFQARILGKVVISSSRGTFPTQGSKPCLLFLLHWPRFFATVPPGNHSLPMCWGVGVGLSLCHVCLFATLWTVALWAPLSMEFSRPTWS